MHMKENIFSNNKPKKYLYKIGKKYFYPKDYYKKYYTPVKSGPYFSSGKPKKMYIKNGKYIHITKPLKLSDFFGPPPPPVFLSPPKPRLLLPAPVREGQRGPIPYGYYYRHAEKVKQKMRDRRLAFNKTLPPLNLICQYCNKPFVLPGIRENGNKQQSKMYCSSICDHRSKKLKKLWIPKWLYNFYLDKKLHRIRASFKQRKNWKLSEFRSTIIPIDKYYRKFIKFCVSDYGHKPAIYQRIKKFFFYKTTSINGKIGYAYRLKSWRRFLFGRERSRCLECGQSILHLAVDANYCNHVCYHNYIYKSQRSLFSLLVGKSFYHAFKRHGLKRIIFAKRRLTKLRGMKMRIRIRFRLWHYYITSPFVRFHRFLFFKCDWCRERLHGPFTQRFCSETHKTRYKKYSKRWAPMWFYRHFYSRYNLYKIRWHYYPRFRNNIKWFFILSKKIFKKLKKKLKEVKKRENHYYKTKERFFTCKHCREEFKRKSSATLNLLNFCSLKCKTLFNEEIIRRRKERNLAAWGTEERPDENTRRIIKNKKSLEYHKKRIAIDPAYKLIKRMRTRTRKVLKGIYKEGKVWKGKKLSIYEKLCISSGNELKEHIEAQWEEGMNWENYGKDRKGWVVDHHIPIAFYKNNFDLLNNLEIQKKAFGKDNLKPMWWLDNARKSAKLEYDARRSRKN